MTKGWVALSVEIGLRMMGTADPSTSLRFGRDDKGWVGFSVKIGLWMRVNRRSLGYARDDKWWRCTSIQVYGWEGEQALCDTGADA
jgi:hypothetical protein